MPECKSTLVTVLPKRRSLTKVAALTGAGSPKTSSSSLLVMRIRYVKPMMKFYFVPEVRSFAAVSRSNNWTGDLAQEKLGLPLLK